jgi:hypothetical protein
VIDGHRLEEPPMKTLFEDLDRIFGALTDAARDIDAEKPCSAKTARPWTPVTLKTGSTAKSLRA